MAEGLLLSSTGFPGRKDGAGPKVEQPGHEWCPEEMTVLAERGLAGYIILRPQNN